MATTGGIDPPLSARKRFLSDRRVIAVACIEKLMQVHDAPRGGDEGIRTPDPLLAKQMLYQLSYIPSAAASWRSSRAVSIPPIGAVQDSCTAA
jgi:hypothetical protein